MQNPDLRSKTIYEEAAEHGFKSLVMWNQFVGRHFDCLNKAREDLLNQTCSKCNSTTCGDVACQNCQAYLGNITWKLPPLAYLLKYVTDPKGYDAGMVTEAIDALNAMPEVPSIIYPLLCKCRPHCPL